MKNHPVWLAIFLACSLSGLGFEAVADSSPTEISKAFSLQIADASANISELASREDSLEARAYDLADRIFRDAKEVHYQHLHEPAKEQVRERDGRLVCRNDCSGFISYVLDSVAPKHYDKNFGVALACWYWFFGTLHYSEEYSKRVTMKFGLGSEAPMTSHRLADLYLAPFKELCLPLLRPPMALLQNKVNRGKSP